MTILIADDDPVTLETLAACVSAEGFQPVLAKNGLEALALWQRCRPALVCLDIMMPQMDGFEVCRKIRAQDKTLPVLFLSAKSEERDVVAGLQLGADDFVRKPFGRQELLARIRAALRRAPAPGAKTDTFTLHDLTVHPHELRAVREGGDIDLTPREVALLRMFHQHAGEVLTRDVLLDACWGLDYFPQSRTLDQHIAKLRQKVEADGTAPAIIETVRGMGYRCRKS